MKKIFCLGIVGFVLAIPGFSQWAPLRAEGLGSWYDYGSGFFASHATLPFGTEVLITNLDTGRQIIVPVGGRIPQNRRWIVEVSPQVADALGMYEVGFTPVRIEEVVRAAVTKAMRTSSVRNFQQNGRAAILSIGADFTVGHPSLSLGRQVRITNRANGQRVVATVKHRVRASQERAIELSWAVAQALEARGSYIDVLIESVDN
jgi:rare lipoprotein A (peptidoglycan hydrolase)